MGIDVYINVIALVINTFEQTFEQIKLIVRYYQICVHGTPPISITILFFTRRGGIQRPRESENYCFYLSLRRSTAPEKRRKGAAYFFYDLALKPRLAVDAGMHTLLRTEHKHAHTDIRRFFASERLSALAATDIFENRYAVDYFFVIESVHEAIRSGFIMIEPFIRIRLRRDILAHFVVEEPVLGDDKAFVETNLPYRLFGIDGAPQAE